MAVRSAADALYDSEALLRWVDRELAELGAFCDGGDTDAPAMTPARAEAHPRAVTWHARGDTASPPAGAVPA